MSLSAPPLILTVELPSGLHRRFTELRRLHYPSERNHLEAHVTLFHALPPMCEDELVRLLARLAGEFAPPSGKVEGVMPWIQGTAIRLSSPGILEMRAAIADHFHGMLAAQDSHPPRLHVTLQNRVMPYMAKALQAELASIILPIDFTFPGLKLHRYRGGPWERLSLHRFRGKVIV